MFFQFDSFELDGRERRLSRNGQPIHLERLPLDLLILLLDRYPRLVAHGEIAEALWPGVPADAADDRSRPAVKKVRAALGAAPADPRFIEAVQRRGYRFKAAVNTKHPGPS